MELNKNGTCQLAIGHADGAPKVEPSIDEPEDDEVWTKKIIIHYPF